MRHKSFIRYTPILQLEEVVEMLRMSENKNGLTFEALSLNLYNKHSDFFTQEHTLRGLRCSLRKLLRANLRYFTLSEEGYYNLYRSTPQQLYINFDEEIEYSFEEDVKSILKSNINLQQLELDFNIYNDEEMQTEFGETEMSIAAENCITYAGGYQQLLLDL